MFVNACWIDGITVNMIMDFGMIIMIVGSVFAKNNSCHNIVAVKGARTIWAS